MKNVFLTIALFIFSGFALLRAQNGAEIYQKACSACHTIGKGKLVGPDLKDLLQKRDRIWTINFIKSSSKMISTGDPLALEIYNEYMKIPMPDMNLSDKEINAVLEYIETQSGSSEAQVATTDQGEFIDNASEQDIETGHLLFTGRKKFENGGASCLSCHDINEKRVLYGGNMAKDLSLSYLNMKAAGIKAILTNPPFPSMAVAYNKAVLTDNEIYALAAYLKSAGSGSERHGLSSFGGQFMMFGFLLFLILNLFLAFYWNRGKIRSTNREILRRQKSTI